METSEERAVRPDSEVERRPLVLFLKPGMGGRRTADAMTPLVFAVIRALTPDSVDIRFHDERIEPLPMPDSFRAAELPDAVAISADTFGALHASRIGRSWRQAGVPVIAGGFHPTLAPEECGEWADAVVIGDAEDTWPLVLADLWAGSLKRRYSAEGDLRRGAASAVSTCGLDAGFAGPVRGADVGLAAPVRGADVGFAGPVRGADDGSSAPAYDTERIFDPRYDNSVFEGKRYNPVRLVQFGRGCRHACDFCAVRGFYGARVKTRPVESVVEEIRRLSDSRLLPLFFVDDNLFADREAADRLLEALGPLRRRWAAQVSMDVAEDRSLLARMRKCGCFMAVVGFESLKEGNLGQMRKRANLAGDARNANLIGEVRNANQAGETRIPHPAENAQTANPFGAVQSTSHPNKFASPEPVAARYRRIIENVHAAGIQIYGTFIFGYDSDTPDVIRETVAFAIDSGLAIANFNPLTPMPGTPLYRRLRDEGRLIRDPWWLDEAYRYGDAAFTPNAMTAEALTEGCREARMRFNSAGAWMSRLWKGRKANAGGLWRLAAFLAANLVSRREILAKQGSALSSETETRPERRQP